MADLDRLGKRGAYRLGRLRARGIAQVSPPEPFRVSFAPPSHRGPLSAWILALLAGTAVVAAGALAGLWFVPFVAGLAAGVAVRFGRWRLRVTLLATVAMAAIGWGAALCWQAAGGEPTGATARVLAALAGLPANAAVGVAATLLVAVLQALAGAWLGRALAPRPDL